MRLDEKELQHITRNLLREWHTKHGDRKVYINNRRHHHGGWGLATWAAGKLLNQPSLCIIGKELMVDDLHDVHEWLSFKTREQEEAENVKRLPFI